MSNSQVSVRPGTGTRKKKKLRVTFWTAECKYSCIIHQVKSLDWKLVEDEKMEQKVNVLWIDVATIHERFRNIQPWQIINHFPGMPNIARKNRMGQNLNRMAKMYPREFSFYPRTWILPSELSDFRSQFGSDGVALGNKIYIVKPDAGCQGRGIFLTRTLDTVPLNDNYVAQLYIKKPLLIDGFKFDLRLYCLVTSVKPLRMYMFHDGLVRLCTEEYVKPSKHNLDKSCMHLTNYAINKNSENFQAPGESDEGDDGGSKRHLSWFMDWIRSEHGDEKADWLWKRMGTLCTRTVLSIMPTLSREYDQHFRSFTNVPKDIRKLYKEVGYSSGAPAGAGGTPSASPSPRHSAARPPTDGDAGSGDAQQQQRRSRSNTRKSTNASASASAAQQLSSGAKDSTGCSGSGSDDDNETLESREDNGGDDTDGAGGDGDRDRNPLVRRGRAGSRQIRSGQSRGDGGEGEVGTEGEDESPTDADADADTEDKSEGPEFRGSRCFEILGFDVMLDSNLNPWLIEVNHLPSFGTDTALDMDIKSRLMEQVFRVLPAQADDQQAYNLHHKIASERRLVAQRRSAQLQREKEEREKEEEKRRNSQRIAAARARREAQLKQQQQQQQELEQQQQLLQQQQLQQQVLLQQEQQEQSSDNICQISTNGLPAGVTPEAVREQLQALLENPLDANVVDEECSPQRLEEIKELLAKLYERYSPEKLSKIDRLLQKYAGHEEEFLRFVFNKYSVSIDLYKAPASLWSAAVRAAALSAGVSSSSVGDSMESDTDPGKTQSSAPPTPTHSEAMREANKRASRSCSPPRTKLPSTGPAGPTASNTNINSNSNNSAGSSAAGSSRRPPAAWKGDAQEDAQFRLEVLAAHMPDLEKDEWLRMETERLVDFTRIFPPLPAPSTADADAEREGETAKEREGAFEGGSGKVHGRPGRQSSDVDSTSGTVADQEDDDEEDDDEDEGDDDATHDTADEDTAGSGKESRGRRDTRDERDCPVRGESAGSGRKGLKTGAGGAAAASSAAASSATADDSTTPKKFKAASYEDIMFQAFLHDKRQTMRLRCPLPSRAIAKNADGDGGTFLPPLDQPSSSGSSSSNSRSSYSSMAGKGVVGWKAPPKPAEKKEPLKQPTQMQADAAKRLSQGLSVANVNSRRSSSNMAYGHGSHHGPTSSVVGGGGSSVGVAAGGMSTFSVVLDPQEYYYSMQSQQQQQMHQYQQHQLQQQQYNQQQHYNQQQQQSAAGHMTGVAAPQSKAIRLLEESRMNRMRLEQAKANSAAVLRQQVFYFDNNNPHAGGGSSVAGSVSGSGPADGLDGGGSLWGDNDTGSVSGSGKGGGGAVAGARRSSFNASGAGLGSGSLKYQRGGGAGAAGTGHGSLHQHAGAAGVLAPHAAAAGGMGIGMRHSMGSVPGTLVGADGKPLGATASTGAGMPVTAASQEELLKQLFPSWF